MKYSGNYSFNLPQRTPGEADRVDINDLTENWEKADELFGGHQGNIEALSKRTDEISAVADEAHENAGIALERIDEVSGELDGHVNDFGNPHFVTAGQTGTYTFSEVNELLEEKVTKAGSLDENKVLVTNEEGSAVTSSISDEELMSLSGIASNVQEQLDARDANQTWVNSNFLSKTNTTAYTPTADYHPATRRFVLDNAGGSGGGVGKKYATVVVGTALMGHTAEEVDVLCTGTNDAAAIDQAIASKLASGGNLIMREGTYNLNGTISIRSQNTHIWGSGLGTILQNDYVSTNANSVLIVANNCSVNSLRISGKTDGSSQSSSMRGIAVGSGYGAITIDSVSIERFNYGAYIQQSSATCRVSNCRFSNNSTSIYCGTNTYYIQILNNRIASGTTGITIAPGADNGYMQVIGNACNGCAGSAIQVSSGIGVVVSGNMCRGNGTGIYVVNGTCHSVNGNMCYGNTTNGIRIGASATVVACIGNSAANNGTNFNIASASVTALNAEPA